MASSPQARICAGIPALNNTLFWRIQFLVGDPVAYLEIPRDGKIHRVLILRDIEMDRAKQKANVDQVACPANFPPEAGLSGDRETATAQSAAECLKREGVQEVIADRSLPFIYAQVLKDAGISVQCDLDLWVSDRRQKSREEVQLLTEAQAMTEGAMEYACHLIASSSVNDDGLLIYENEILTAERVRRAIDLWLLDRNYSNPSSIIACGPIGADCHDLGSGPLRTEVPIIVDIFPQNKATKYNGDCTRTVVHGTIPDAITHMHQFVVKAKEAGEAATRAGVTGESVHKATIQVLLDAGFSTGLPTENDPPDFCAMTHGTGHGIGLEVHEPPLLDFKGPQLLIGDALTIEPGLYRRDLGGVRVEDMVVVTEDGCINLNNLQEGLNWA